MTNVKHETKKLNTILTNYIHNNIPISLNLGSGDVIITDYINIDLYNKDADVNLDINNTLPIDDGTIESILSSHVIDHFDFKDGKEMIADWSRILRPGGTVRVECTDLYAVCKMLPNVDKSTQMKLYSCLFGFPWFAGYAHKFGWSYPLLMEVMMENDFNSFQFVKLIEVEDYSLEKITENDLSYDGSLDWFDSETFEKLNISLIATKETYSDELK